MRKTVVLGISGSPRENGNTSALVKECLRGASAAGGATEFVSLATRTVHPCRGCTAICHPTASSGAELAAVLAAGPWNLCIQKDGAREVIGRMAQADVILIGSPVYLAGLTAQTKALFDRCTCLGQTNPSGGRVKLLENRIGAAVAVGGCRHGGQSYVLESIMGFFLMLNMLPVGFAEREDQVYGLSGVAQSPGDIEADVFQNYLGKPDSAMKQAEDYGRKLVHVAELLRGGLRPED